MMLSDVLDYVESLGIAEHVYMGKLDSKKEKSVGVYNSKHQYAPETTVDGSELSYGTKHITLLVHWTESLRDTEKVAHELYDTLKATRDVNVNNETIIYVKPEYEPQDIGTDNKGICEIVLELTVYYKK